jgi:hypothetical protein
MTRRLKGEEGLILTEAVLILIGIILPILFAATTLTNLLNQQNELELLNRQATRLFALAPSNAIGMASVDQLIAEQIEFEEPVIMKVTCSEQCLPGTTYQINSQVKVKIIAIPFIPDLTITLASKSVSLLDRFVSR